MSGMPEPAAGDPGDAPQPPLAGTAATGRLRLGQAVFASFYADALLAVLAILVVRYLVGRLGAEPYGILGIVSVLAGQLGILHFGVGTAATRLVADSVGRGGEGRLPRLIGTAVVGAVFFGLASAGVVKRLQRLSGHSPPRAGRGALRGRASGPHPSLRRRLRRAHGSRAVPVRGRSARLPGCGPPARRGRCGNPRGGVAAIFWAQAVIDLAAVAVGSGRAWRDARPRIAGEPVRAQPVGAADGGGRVSIAKAAATVLAVGAPFALVSLLSGLLTDAEKLAVGLVRSVEDFTYYTVPYNAVVKFAVISGAVVRVLMPRLAALDASGAGSEALALTERADRILVTGMVGMLAPVVALTPELLGLWLGETFVARSTVATRVLLLGVAVNAAAFPSHAVVLARGRPAYLTLLYTAEVALHLVLVYLLVTGFGLVGAAAAWTLRVGLDALAQRLLAERTLGSALGDGPLVWGVIALLALLVAAAPALSLPLRLGAGGTVAGVCLLFLTRGPDRGVLLDSLLPWRWGGGGAR